MLVIGSRGSDLALAQARWIQARILELFPGTETSIRIIKTAGDKDTTSSIRTGSNVGVFVKELERALLDKEIDVAVHSMKDLPTGMQQGLKIAAIPEREDVRDAIISGSNAGFMELAPGTRIGTGSLRRQAQLLSLRPDLRVVDIRGNLNTRLRKLAEGSYDALVLATAGLNRLGLQDRITGSFSLDQILPAPGQGALAVQTRDDDHATLAVASALNHAATSLEVRSERVFLHHVGGGCNVPVAVYAKIDGGRIRLTGLITSPDGSHALKHFLDGKPETADETAHELADLILKRGGRAILDAL